MVSNHEDKAGAMPSPDEGWWASVLAEEERHAKFADRAVKGSPARQENAETKGLNWSEVRDLYHQDKIVQLMVTGYNRGGVLVEGEGLQGFVPLSHLVDLPNNNELPDREQALESYVGRSLSLKVIECAPEDGRVVFSERAAQSEPGKRKHLFKNLASGQKVGGSVTNITDFGVFIDLGGVEGLIHISELSWGRVIHPSQVVELGSHLEALVLEVSPERCRVALSLKRLQSNPWDLAGVEFSLGQVLPATITSVVSYGAFARLDSGVEGLIHASEMPLEGGQSVREIAHEGQEVKVRILHIDAANQRMGLSLKMDED